jgi:hypothetical protein
MIKGVGKQHYVGPWEVLPGDSLQRHPRLRRGQILKHWSNNTILNCPACNAMQYAAVQVIGTQDRPTLSGDVTCGAGHCKRCAITFTVVDGRTVVKDVKVKEHTGGRPPSKVNAQ